MAGKSGEDPIMIRKIITFMILFSFGVTTVSLSARNDMNVRVELVTPEEDLAIGSAVELRCVVNGCDGTYHVVWQYLDEDVGYWQSMETIGETCCFILDEVNINFYYRVVITY